MRGGLWVLLEKLRQQQVPERESLVPLIKIWYAVHHSNLAWKSVTDTVTELKVANEELKSISTYFHTSKVRIRSTQKKLLMNIIAYTKIPSILSNPLHRVPFEVIHAYLSSWEATTLCFRDKSKKREEDIHFKFMTNNFKLHLMTFVADVLAVFKR